VAEKMREEVTAMVGSGKSETEIINYYRKEYGETILVVPDGMSGGLLTYTPVLLFAASAGLLIFFIRSSVRARRETAPQPAPSLPEADRLAIQKKIRAEIGNDW
jgi:cytochrome c-type biogenesis protein CcmH/NrfF